MNMQEIDALYGYDEFLFKLYFFAIRRHMDYQTGIVGTKKRRICWDYLREMMRIESRSGVKEKLPGLSQVRRAVKTLIRIGLLRNISSKTNLIFECPMATQDKSVQNKVDKKPTPLLKGGLDRVETRTNTDRVGLTEFYFAEADIEADTPKSTEVGTLPLSVKSKEKEIITKQIISKKKTQIPKNFMVTDHHVELARQNQWPHPDSEIEAFRDFHMARGTTMLDWDRAFYTWLRNAVKFKGGNRGGNYQRPERKNSFDIGIQNIIDSAKGSR